MKHVTLRLSIVTVVLVVAAPAAHAQPRPIVSYARSGGFIGGTETLTVFRDGRATSSRGRFRLSAQRLGALQATLRNARFASLSREYRASVPVADGYTYRVTHAGRPVVAEDGAKVPARLQRLLTLLESMLSGRR